MVLQIKLANNYRVLSKMMQYFSGFIVFLIISMISFMAISITFKIRISEMSIIFVFVMIIIDVITTEKNLTGSDFSIISISPLLLFITVNLIVYLFMAKNAIADGKEWNSSFKLTLFSNITMCLVVAIGYLLL